MDLEKDTRNEIKVQRDERHVKKREQFKVLKTAEVGEVFWPQR